MNGMVFVEFVVL